jgi:antitoxin ParD1/3/4
MATTVDKITIALPPEVAASVYEAVATGEYGSSSEVVREALRDWHRKRQLQQNGIAELRKLWQEAKADTSPGLDPDSVFAELERKYQAMAANAGSTP